MTWLPVVNASLSFIFLVSAILWHLSGVLFVLAFLGVSVTFLWLESASLVNLHYVDSFWMFILSEVLIFGSLLTGCLWFQECDMVSLSDYKEIPLFGCFLLIGSSLTVTSYHHTMGVREAGLHLTATIILGLGFIALQMVEFSECPVYMFSSVYHACCFSAVGLHFSHVLIGVVGLINLLVVGAKVFGEYYSTLVVWYWHFVDYVWLFVYTVVYLC
uniref:Cytochrome c oxidase subunit 3 n=1 Tax=Cichlidogyrus mbirizei TaxID=2094302 RepID=A0A344ANV0_9PLAT|nr:cytochrome c oxidase subunit III [Cichlidogyrus mbirizei]